MTDVDVVTAMGVAQILYLLCNLSKQIGNAIAIYIMVSTHNLCMQMHLCGTA